MYEVSNKNIRLKFKKTEYGKKVNKMLYISIGVASCLFIISCVVYFITRVSDKVLTNQENAWLNLLFGITLFFVIIACYFDGKRDGAIEQFKIDNKK